MPDSGNMGSATRTLAKEFPQQGFPCSAKDGKRVKPAECFKLTCDKTTNSQHCKKKQCESPGHLCFACILEKYTEADAVVTNLEKGFCDFHTQNGFAASRNGKTATSATILAADVVPSSAKPVATPVPPQPVTSEGVSAEDRLLAFARGLGTRPPPPTDASAPTSTAPSVTSAAKGPTPVELARAAAFAKPSAEKPRQSAAAPTPSAKTSAPASVRKPPASASVPVALPPRPPATVAPVAKPAPAAKPTSAPAPASAPVPNVAAPAPESANVVSTPVEKPSEVTPSVVGQILRVHVSRIIRQPGQPRTEFDPAELRSLSVSIKRRQIMPVLFAKVDGMADVDFMIVDGERRWIAAKMAGVDFLLGIYYEGLTVADAKEIYKTSVMANFNRSDHSPLERAHIVLRLQREYNMNWADITSELGISEFTLKRDLRLLALPPEVQAMMSKEVPEEKRLLATQALLSINYPAAFQIKVAKELTSRPRSIHAAAFHVRKRAEEEEVVEDRTGVRGRSPFDYFRNLLSGLAGVGGRVDGYRYPPGKTLEEVLQVRSAEELEELADALQSVIKPAQDMAALVAEIVSKKSKG